MRQNPLSSFTLAVILLIAVGIGYNQNAGAAPPKETKTVVKTVKKKPEKAKSSTQQMTAMSQILKSNTDSMSSKLAIKMAGTGTEFVMGGKVKGMGFRGTGGGSGGLGNLTTTKVVKKKRAKPAQKEAVPATPQRLRCSEAVPVYDEPAMTPLE